MKQISIIFKKPYEVDIQVHPVPEVEENKVLVKTKWSAISPGSEMLVYKGLVPSGWPIDSTIQSLGGTFQYPVKYGYTTVGEIVAVGPRVRDDWLGRSVFSSHPHESYFLAKPDEIICIPSEIDSTEALFLPNMETAVNLLMDGAPIIGSWYGTKTANLELGKDFHRNRIRLISSQVSTIAPRFTGRWTKSRRIGIVWKMIRSIKPERFITHRFHVSQVKQAFELLDKKPEDAIQVVLSYDE